MKPRGDGGAADGKMPAQLGSCAGIALPSGGWAVVCAGSVGAGVFAQFPAPLRLRLGRM